MRSSRTVTLFTESPDFSQRPTSFLFSILFHCVAIALVSFAVMYSPRLDTRASAERFTVRSLDLETPQQRMQRSARGKVRYPGPQPGRHAAPPGPKPSDHAPSLRQVAKGRTGPQTLVQPDVRPEPKLTQEIPIPTVLIWTPQRTPVKVIVAPQPEKPTAANVAPSLDLPNEEVNLADVSISTKPVPAPKLAVQPSTTSPISVQTPQTVQLPPATVSQPTTQPTPTSVMSLSDLRMDQGRVELPPVNESAAANSPGTLEPGKTDDSSTAGNSNPNARASSGQSAADAAEPPGQDGPAAKQDGQESSPPQGTENGNGKGSQPASTRITLPKDGDFGAVVVGDTLEDQFPELGGVWRGRLAYTVYLHVGLARSWILQYSLPLSDEAAAAGSVAHLEAPWPFNIVRPNLAPGEVEADTILVHGFVNLAGRFEQLSVVFPSQFPQEQFILKSLQQWQFRPAAQDGQIARVEVLLIIPEELN